MYVRPVRRICDVRGCKNKDCFSISRVKEAGNTPVLCKSCLGSALSALDEPEVVKAGEKKPIPSLFFNSVALPKASEEEKPKAKDERDNDALAPTGDEEGQKAEDETNLSDEKGEGVKVVPNGEVENLVAPSEPSRESLKTEDNPSVSGADKASEEEKPKAKKRTTKKGEK